MPKNHSRRFHWYGAGGPRQRLRSSNHRWSKDSLSLAAFYWHARLKTWVITSGTKDPVPWQEGKDSFSVFSAAAKNFGTIPFRPTTRVNQVKRSVLVGSASGLRSSQTKKNS